MTRLALLALLASTLAACSLPAPAPPKPSMWQLESECAESRPLSEVQSCTRNRLDMEYGAAWRSAPQANVFLDFIGSTADRVSRGELSEADGRLAISNYASQQFQVFQAERQALAAQQAQQNAANMELGLALLEQSRSYQPVPPPMTPMAPMGIVGGNLSCGLAPLPPFGCRVGPCVCDGSGQSCRYQMLCN